MDDTTKSILKAVLIATAEKVGMALGTALVAKGLLAPGLISGFDQIFVGFIVGVFSVAAAWYRANGAALVQAELKKLKAMADTAAAEAELKRLEMQRQLEAAQVAAGWTTKTTPPQPIKQPTTSMLPPDARK